MILRIKTKQQVWLLTAAITAMTVIVPFMIALACLWIFADNFNAEFSRPFVAIAVLVPLFLMPPISFVVLELIRLQTEMIRTVDKRIMFDMLTGALNRNHFLDNMRASQLAGPIMIVDADHFKVINDRNGHAIGDEALRILANAIQKTVGKAGTVGRLGGEEFGVFLAGKSEAEGHECAEAICEAIRKLSPFMSGSQVTLTVSVGCAFHRPARVIGHSLKVADDLLYRAKAEGRDRAVYIPLQMQRRSA